MYYGFWTIEPKQGMTKSVKANTFEEACRKLGFDPSTSITKKWQPA